MKRTIFLGFFLIILAVIIGTFFVRADNYLQAGVNQPTILRASCIGSNPEAWITVYKGTSTKPDDVVLSLTKMNNYSSQEFNQNITFTSSGIYTAYETCIFNGISQKKSFMINVSDVSTIITNSSYRLYNYQATYPSYNVYFRSNTNLDSPVRFEKEGYFFIYDISQGTMTWIGLPGQPSASNTLGSGMSSNSEDTTAKVSGTNISYQPAFFNTTVSYTMSSDRVKEVFKLTGVAFKNYDYLQYSGQVRFNASLKICTDEKCYVPSGTQDDFETSGKIYFKNNNDEIIFYLNNPVIIDSANHTTNGLYSVHGSNAQMNFWLRINRTWLQTATFPVYIDPTIELPDGTIIEMIPNINPANLTASSGVPVIVNTTLRLGNVTLKDPLAECELDIINNANGLKVVDYRSLYNDVDSGTFLYTWNNPSIGNYTVVEYCWRGDTLNLVKIYGNTTITVT